MSKKKVETKKWSLKSESVDNTPSIATIDFRLGGSIQKFSFDDVVEIYELLNKFFCENKVDRVKKVTLRWSNRSITLSGHEANDFLILLKNVLGKNVMWYTWTSTTTTDYDYTKTYPVITCDNTSGTSTYTYAFNTTTSDTGHWNLSVSA